MQTDIEIIEQQERFVAHYRFLESRVLASEPEWLTSQRQTAIGLFRDAGFPTTRDEDWRYTNVSPITQTDFEPALDASEIRTDSATFTGPVAARLVFVDGLYSAKHSQIGELPAGVRIENLRSLLADSTGRDLLRVYLGRTVQLGRNAFAALNTALWQDGAFMLIPHGVALKDPVHLVFLSGAQAKPSSAHPRALLVADRNAQATIIETFQSPGDGLSLCNAVTEIVAAENAVVDYYRSVQESNRSFHVGQVQIYAGRNAQVAAFSASLGGSLVRNEVRAVLDAEGADCTLNGIYTAKGVEHVDNHTTIDHAKPHGSSRQHYNGVLDGHSTAVFNGRVIVRPDAQKTDATQKNRNLLLSADATIDTKPQLEISANDVRCTHGATVGQMDAEALFFLRSRGLDREAAAALLVEAFAGEILDTIKPDGFRHWLTDALRGKFSGTASAGNR